MPQTLGPYVCIGFGGGPYFCVGLGGMSTTERAQFEAGATALESLPGWSVERRDEL
jgi:hypothetical protein